MPACPAIFGFKAMLKPAPLLEPTSNLFFFYPHGRVLIPVQPTFPLWAAKCNRHFFVYEKKQARKMGGNESKMGCSAFSLGPKFKSFYHTISFGGRGQCFCSFQFFCSFFQPLSWIPPTHHRAVDAAPGAGRKSLLKIYPPTPDFASIDMSCLHLLCCSIV